eukprot:TRINITY_DN3054_c1_g3_i1.p1 TRINITY_DN3054_c1_g3~~TRINITY_DN3054_c1_g3_i1.p1  ORF type:complete len:251 (+),score=68.70 TRINITY_DN3054_c1_g3_i1:132-884(+)
MSTKRRGGLKSNKSKRGRSKRGGRGGRGGTRNNVNNNVNEENNNIKEEEILEDKVIVKHQDEEGEDDPFCLVCTEKIEYFSIGDCNHTVICSECSLKMRLLFNNRKCIVCKKELKTVIFTKHQNKKFKKFNNIKKMAKVSSLGIRFEDKKIEKRTVEFFKKKCKLCEKTFADKNQLKLHIEKDHDRHFCDVCLEYNNCFLIELPMYTKKELATHMVGDPKAIDPREKEGHPMCEFCNKGFFDKEQLWFEY